MNTVVLDCEGSVLSCWDGAGGERGVLGAEQAQRGRRWERSELDAWEGGSRT